VTSLINKYIEGFRKDLSIKKIHQQIQTPHVFAKELTNRAFCRLLIQTAHGLGFHVKRWPLADAAGLGGQKT